MHRLDVIGRDTTDIIRSAGGWLYDRATTRWDVRVLLGEHRDPRALRILGARTSQLRPTMPTDPEPPRALAVAAEMFATNPQVRTLVLTALDRELTEVILWGNTCPAELRPHLNTVQHRLSTATQAFKAQALVAAAQPAHPISPTETLRITPLHRLATLSGLPYRHI
jgi:hypothetical protein